MARQTVFPETMVGNASPWAALPTSGPHMCAWWTWPRLSYSEAKPNPLSSSGFMSSSRPKSTGNLSLKPAPPRSNWEVVSRQKTPGFTMCTPQLLFIEEATVPSERPFDLCMKSELKMMWRTWLSRSRWCRGSCSKWLKLSGKRSKLHIAQGKSRTLTSL